MSKLNTTLNNKQSGYENFDDCAIYKINEEQSIIQTVDFFTPIVDDPYSFGLIAASNSLSDIYAMGGKPLFALNIVAFPVDELNLDILSDILRGGKDKCLEDNVNILGGHSIKDKTPKYGLAVTGIINNNKILRNSTANENDIIILTKPLGTGIIGTAIKKNKVENQIVKDTIELMATLNNNLAKVIQKTDFPINACTDVTGYGLLGHLREMTNSSNLTAQINFNSVPFINGVKNLAKKNIIPGGTKNNLNYIQNDILFEDNIMPYQKLMLADAQTSGGLLISVPKENAKKILKELNHNSKYQSYIIGNFIKKQKFSIIVNNG